jgi:hypothetical protein
MLLALIMLTQLDGHPIWVESTAIIAVKPASGQCNKPSNAGIRLGTINLCVLETPGQIRELIYNANQPTGR